MFKKLVFLSLLLLVCLLPGTGSAQEIQHLATETQLNDLDQNLDLLASVNQRLRSDLQLSRMDSQTALQKLEQSEQKLAASEKRLTELETRLATQEKQLATLREESTKAKQASIEAQTSLANANKLLETYVQQGRAKIKQAQLERNLALVALGYLLVTR